MPLPVAYLLLSQVPYFWNMALSVCCSPCACTHAHREVDLPSLSCESSSIASSNPTHPSINCCQMNCWHSLCSKERAKLHITVCIHMYVCIMSIRLIGSFNLDLVTPPCTSCSLTHMCNLYYPLLISFHCPSLLKLSLSPLFILCFFF